MPFDGGGQETKMASVRIDFEDLDADALPDMCMRCAAPAAVRKVRAFAWQPQWIAILILAGLLPYIVVALILTKRRRVAVPLCERHQGHFAWRLWTGLIGFGVVALLFFGGIALAAGSSSSSSPSGRAADELYGLVFGSCCLAFVAWLILIVVLQQTAIRPSEITDFSITLQNVSYDFLRAYEHEVRGYGRRFGRPPPDAWDSGRGYDRRLDDFDAPRNRPRPDAPPDAIEPGEGRPPPPTV
jgi:hypothetical protein